MSTHAAIVVEDEGVYRSVYLHYDGYLNHTGRILKEYYSDLKLALQLISKGDLSCLCDDGEAKALPGADGAKSHPSLKGVCDYYHDMEYIYLWEDGHWSLVDRMSGYRLDYYDHESIDHAHCDICGSMKFIDENEYLSEWAPEVFLHDHNIGRGCPDCLDSYCKFEEGTRKWFISLKNIVKCNLTEPVIFLDQILKTAGPQIKN
jgi:hypothetical protein